MQVPFIKIPKIILSVDKPTPVQATQNALPVRNRSFKKRSLSPSQMHASAGLPEIAAVDFDGLGSGSRSGESPPTQRPPAPRTQGLAARCEDASKVAGEARFASRGGCHRLACTGGCHVRKPSASALDPTEQAPQGTSQVADRDWSTGSSTRWCSPDNSSSLNRLRCDTRTCPNAAADSATMFIRFRSRLFRNNRPHWRVPVGVVFQSHASPELSVWTRLAESLQPRSRSWFPRMILVNPPSRR